MSDRELIETYRRERAKRVADKERASRVPLPAGYVPIGDWWEPAVYCAQLDREIAWIDERLGQLEGGGAG